MNNDFLNASRNLSLPALLRAQSEQNPGAVAIAGCAGAPLRYGRLFAFIDSTIETLNAMGIGRNDRVAIVIPNGPEMAVAFLAVAACATSAPLNPAYQADEFEFYLSDLNAKALIVQAGMDSPASRVARAKGIPIVELSPRPGAEAGMFDLTGDRAPRASQGGFAQAEDTALVLHTSGTTSRPKIVPLSHVNLCASALNIKKSIELVSSDVCLNVMPLFHIHGLVGATLASLLSGASVVCTPGFYAPKFFEWIEQFRPTWYTAVPTMHQAILARASANRETIARRYLRFIRSSSSALPPQVMAELESVFDVPVIESYGMTEASHQMTSNPLPPRKRKPGSVGVAAGPEVAIMDEAGNLLGAGETGEIVIRGANVTRGYENNPDSNQSAFTDGWFRTGDQGYMDAEGFLFITGRLKEIINRGGEKISPREVDEVLMDHPAVAQAVTFAVPDTKLGEDVAAAVVLRETSFVTEKQLREFAAERLAFFKVPGQFVFLSEIPKGATGKLQRIGLAEKLGVGPLNGHSLEPRPDYTPPSTSTQEALAGIWAEVLGLEQVGITDNFFHLGGDSILATQIVSRVREILEAEVSLINFFEAPTVAELANTVEASRASRALQPPLIPVSRKQELPLSFAQQRLWFIDQLDPGNSAYNSPLAIRLSGELDVKALERSLNEIARRHEALRTTFARAAGKQPTQVIASHIDIELPLTDLSELNEAERKERLEQLSSQAAERPFDLSTGPLVRAAVLRLAHTEHVLLVTIHHIVFDGWSRGVFLRELGALYETFVLGEPPRLGELPIQYADYAVWQRECLQGESLDKLLDYWKQKLAGAPDAIQLPADRPRPAGRSYKGAQHYLLLPAGLTMKLEELSKQEGVTLFMTLLAAFNLMLSKLTGQQDIVVGTDVAGRNRAELEGLIGFFVNHVVMRTEVRGKDRFREYLRRVGKDAVEAFAHQDLPFDRLVEELQPERRPGHTPLFNVLFVMQNAPVHPAQLSGLTLSTVEVFNQTTKYDLTLFVERGADGLLTTWRYNSDLFDQASISRLATSFSTLVDKIVGRPEAELEELDMESEEEVERAAEQKQQRKQTRASLLKSARRKTLDLSQPSLVRSSLLSGSRLPLVLEPVLPGLDLAEWARLNRDYLDRLLLTHGGLLLRGFGIDSIERFEQVADAICPSLFSDYGDLPRRGQGGKVYDATPYPADEAILFHNESSHLQRWPMKIFFHCVKAPSKGGSTPLVDCRRLYERLRPEVRMRLKDKHLLYVRNFSEGLDVSWQEFFSTTDREEVARRCQQAGVKMRWKDGGVLETRQVRRAVSRHPRTGEDIFFNQIQLHHERCLNEAVRESLRAMMGEGNYPRQVYYGDGTEIKEEVVLHISELYEEEAVRFVWEAGDVLVIDNMLVAHGRDRYEGERKVVVAMGEMIEETDLVERTLAEHNL